MNIDNLIEVEWEQFKGLVLAVKGVPTSSHGFLKAVYFAGAKGAIAAHSRICDGIDQGVLTEDEGNDAMLEVQTEINTFFAAFLERQGRDPRKQCVWYEF